MSLRNAAFLALVGMLLLSLVLTFDFINTLLAVARNLVPALAVVRSLIYLFASVCVTIFFYVFGQRQSR